MNREEIAKKHGFVPCNLHEPGTKEYYRDALDLILLTAINYDGRDIDDPQDMKELVDDLVEIASTALNDDALYFKSKEKP